MQEILEVLKVAVPAIITGLCGIIIAATRLSAANNQKIQLLLSKIEALEVLSTQLVALQKTVEGLRGDLVAVENSFQIAQAGVPSKDFFTGTQSRLQTLEGQHALMVNELTKQAKDLADFVKEQGASWKKVERTFGRLEGRMHGFLDTLEEKAP